MGKIAFNSVLVFAAVLGLLLGGCGSATKEGAEDATVSASRIDNTNCTSTCHAATTSEVASAIPGATIPTDWAASKHATTGAADCQSCHGGGSNHWGLGPIPSANPDTDKVCVTCHSNMPAPHNNSVAPNGEAYPASYINSQDQGQCRVCHNPHNPTAQMAINVEWASSGKGTVTNAAWEHYDFKTRGTSGVNPANSFATDCVRCHTTTGYINYVSSNFLKVNAWATAADTTKEVLQCNACHDKTYNFASQRNPGSVRAYYNYSSLNKIRLLVNYLFPDIGKSNVCLSCHVARESGLTLAALAALPRSKNPSDPTAGFVNYSSQSFINSHYLTAGATLFGISGNEFAGKNYADPPGFLHKSLGTAALPNGRPGVGPCITCHMQTTSAVVGKASHRFDPELTNGVGADCVGCHTGSVVVVDQATLDIQETGYKNALAVLASALKFRGFTFTQANPYFSAKNWAKPYGKATAENTMGAAFNFNLLVHDPGGFAHNSTYSKRLIYDSIVWIATGSLTPPGGDITAVINDTTSIPAGNNDLVATTSGPAITLTPAMRTAAIVWLTNNNANVLGARP